MVLTRSGSWILIRNSEQDIGALRRREHYRRESSKNVRAGPWGEGVQTLSVEHNSHCRQYLTAAPAACTRPGLPTTSHGWRGDHGSYHYLMDFHLVVDSGGETVIYFHCGPTAKPTVSQALNTFKLMIRKWACLKSVNHKRMQTDISVGKWNDRVEGDWKKVEREKRGWSERDQNALYTSAKLLKSKLTK